MRKLVVILSFSPFAAFAQDGSSVAPPPTSQGALVSSIANSQTNSGTNTLYEGTVITMTLDEEISSQNAHDGQVLTFTTTQPVTINNSVLIPSGCKAYGKVTDYSKRKALGKAGTLDFSIEYLLLPGGRSILLNGDGGKKGKAKGGTAVAEAVIFTPFFLLKKGKSAKFKKGYEFKAFVEKDYQL